MEYSDVKRYAEEYYRKHPEASWKDSMINAAMAGKETIERFACKQRQDHYYPRGY